MLEVLPKQLFDAAQKGSVWRAKEMCLGSSGRLGTGLIDRLPGRHKPPKETIWGQ